MDVVVCLAETVDLAALALALGWNCARQTGGGGAAASVGFTGVGLRELALLRMGNMSALPPAIGRGRTDARGGGVGRALEAAIVR